MRMGKIILFVSIIILSGAVIAQDKTSFKLPAPDTTGGLPVMKALSERASVRDFDTTSPDMNVISNLLWSANGINRHESGKRTAPSAMNSQDADVYLLTKQGAYFYNAAAHSIELISGGDYRKLAAGKQENVADAPLFCLLVSDISRFKSGSDSLKAIWGALDAGIVSQNISIYCASAGLATVPRATMEQEKLREVLRLKDSQKLILNHPVGFKKR
jgi:SagB-type dehydrogenase family enzyme